MTTKIERRVHMARYSDHISIMLAYIVRDENGDSEGKDKFMQFPVGGVASQVELAINKLVSKWVCVFFGISDMSLISDNIEDNATLFDALLSSDHAENDFLALE